MRTPLFLSLLVCLSTQLACFSNQPKPEITADQIAFDALVSRFEAEDRLNWQKPNQIIEMMGDLSDKTVADIGAGTGYFAFRLATKAKKVIAIEIDQRFIDFMDSLSAKLPQSVQDNIETRLATFEDSKLKPNEADIILLVNVYYQMDKAIDYFKNLAQVLHADTQVFIIDYKKSGHNINKYGPPIEERTSMANTIKNMEAAGYRLTMEESKMLPYQYMLQFIVER